MALTRLTPRPTVLSDRSGQPTSLPRRLAPTPFSIRLSSAAPHSQRNPARTSPKEPVSARWLLAQLATALHRTRQRALLRVNDICGSSNQRSRSTLRGRRQLTNSPTSPSCPDPDRSVAARKQSAAVRGNRLCRLRNMHHRYRGLAHAALNQTSG